MHSLRKSFASHMDHAFGLQLSYVDSFVEDEISPIGSTRPSVHAGTYFSHLPKMPRLDLRLEGLYTDAPGQSPTGFLYWNGRYRSGYTNEGNLLASWVGRQGCGGEGWATYWLSPRRKLQFKFRQAEADKAFIGGGRLHDIGGAGDFMLGADFGLSGLVQYEQWKFPVLSSHPQSNFTSSMQLNFYPHWRIGSALQRNVRESK